MQVIYQTYNTAHLGQLCALARDIPASLFSFK